MNEQSKQGISFEKIMEKYGKTCLEREMAFDRIAELEQELNQLKQTEEDGRSNS